MANRKDKIASSFKKVTENAKSVLDQPERVRKLIDASREKLAKLELADDDFKGILGTLKTFIRMLKASRSGQYDLPWITILMVVAALIYFVMPLDALPDFIPITGYLDDFAVIVAIYKKFKHDIDAFQAWEAG
ncbi:MAG: hypothetical protein DHS20C17_04940 [Cyclobacteriaceae bacterium]|nr:MAG: hypothetical protein DHS20C17_04940 [Cyclobacteriaceae bacterium]